MSATAALSGQHFYAEPTSFSTSVPMINSGGGSKSSSNPQKVVKRSAAGETWVDPTLSDWPDNDYRLFVANMGPEVTDEILSASFSKYKTFAKCRVVKPKIGMGGQGKIKPYGFVSFIDPWDALAALKEMDGAYIGGRPCSLRKSNWEARGASGAKKSKF
jgi:RNA recognition motif-containing protein